MSSIDDTRRDSWRGRKRRAVRRPSLNVERDNGIRSFSADLGSTEETDEGDEHRPAHTSSSCSTSKRTISSFDGRRTTNFVRGRERRSRRFNWTPRSFFFPLWPKFVDDVEVSLSPIDLEDLLDKSLLNRLKRSRRSSTFSSLNSLRRKSEHAIDHYIFLFID